MAADVSAGAGPTETGTVPALTLLGGMQGDEYDSLHRDYFAEPESEGPTMTVDLNAPTFEVDVVARIPSAG